MRLSLVTALAAVSLSAVATAQTPKEPTFTPEGFRSHVAFLADDLLEGRDTGSRGYEIASRYVATQFEGLGLKPAVNGNWYQPVNFVRYGKGEGTASVAIGGKALEYGTEAVVAASPYEDATSIEAPVVFVGYGIDAPELGYDDYAGLDVRGKIVAILNTMPKGLATDVTSHLRAQKGLTAAARGAAGIILLETRDPNPRASFARIASYAGHESMTWVDANGTPFASGGIRFSGALSRDAAAKLFEGTATSYDAILTEVEREGGKPKGMALPQPITIQQQNKVERFSSPNVIGMIPGSDPALADEYVLLMGHLDHVGVSGDGPDTIHNGAMDNSTGISTLLEAARAMQESGVAPRRPILFAAVTGEEKGLLGSQYLAKHPVMGDGRVVAVVNLDMPVLLYDFQDVIAFGAEHSTLGPIVERAGAKMGVTLTPDPLPQEGLFTRSDHYRFVQEGIPSVFLMTGFANGGEEKFTGFLATDYHKPSDELDLPFDWNAGAKFARINYLIAREIADAEQAPRWYSDSFFGKTFAPDAEKASK